MDSLYSFVTDFEKQIFCIDLIANAFRRSMQKQDCFRYFLPFFCSIIYLFEKRKRKLREIILVLLTLKGKVKLLIISFQSIVSVIIIISKKLQFQLF